MASIPAPRADIGDRVSEIMQRERSEPCDTDKCVCFPGLMQGTLWHRPVQAVSMRAEYRALSLPRVSCPDVLCGENVEVLEVL